MDTQDKEKITKLAGQIIQLSHDDILIHLRFFDTALAKLKWQGRQGMGCIATDGSTCFYDPVYILKTYQQEPKAVTRILLHMLLHCIFSHGFQYNKLETENWDLAADIAVENVILDMQLPGAALEQDGDAARKLRILKEDVGTLTAERIYRYLRHNPLTDNERAELTHLFQKDVHTLWMPREEMELTLEQWKKISERIKADLKSFTKAKSGAEALEKNLEETTVKRFKISV